MADRVDPNSIETMNVDKIVPNDRRLNHCFTEVNGHRWHYLDAAAKGAQRGVVVLVHGFPDLSLAWRYQIPMLQNLGLRCIAIDCMGYGQTGTSSDLNDFTLKNHADAIAGIAKEIGASRIILGGHDWGGAVVWRAVSWYPELVTHAFSVCVPFFPIHDQFIPTEIMVKGPVPQFGYQLQLGSEERIIEKHVKDEQSIRKFLKGIYGGRPSSGKPFLTPEHGVDIEVMRHEDVAMTPLLSEEELNFYVGEFMRNGMNGPCNWYRTRRLNFDQDLLIPAEQKKGVTQPCLFIQALGDSILTPELSHGMEARVPNVTRDEVKTSHWALWQAPAEVNAILTRWFEGVVFAGKSKI